MWGILRDFDAVDSAVIFVLVVHRQRGSLHRVPWTHQIQKLISWFLHSNINTWSGSRTARVLHTSCPTLTWRWPSRSFTGPPAAQQAEHMFTGLHTQWQHEETRPLKHKLPLSPPAKSSRNPFNTWCSSAPSLSESKSTAVKSIKIRIGHFKVKAVVVRRVQGRAAGLVRRRRSHAGEICVEWHVGSSGVQIRERARA